MDDGINLSTKNIQDKDYEVKVINWLILITREFPHGAYFLRRAGSGGAKVFLSSKRFPFSLQSAAHGAQLFDQRGAGILV